LQADIAMIRAVIATSLGIAVHDHIVISKDGHASLKRDLGDRARLKPRSPDERCDPVIQPIDHRSV
jgi:hypothetical protein